MPTELAEDTTKAAVAMDGPEIVAMNAAPLKAEKPTGEEVELAEVFFTSRTQASGPAAELQESLPATATLMPLIGLVGLLSMGTAVTLRLAAARAK